jgi:release factor glutamine methyltransferase
LVRIREALVQAAARLAAVGQTPRLDAELLMAHALGTSRERLLLLAMDEASPESFEALVHRRLAHEPVAYITGRRAFWTIELGVAPGVLIPRPDSETLIEAALAHFGDPGPRRILDLGTGPGTLLLAALDQWPDATGVGIDGSEAALAIARGNAERLGLSPRAELRLGDWGEGIEEGFDLILCNPPYVETGAELPPEVARWEPHEALFAGADGLEDYRTLAAQTARLLGSGGIACFEIGAGQAAAVSLLFEAEGFSVAQKRDLSGTVRCLLIAY